MHIVPLAPAITPRPRQCRGVTGTVTSVKGQTALKTTIGLSPFQMVYGKACHLPVEMEHQALWALKFLNYDPGDTIEKRRRQIIELEEMRLHAYDSYKNYKEKVKFYHDRKLIKKIFNPGQHVAVQFPTKTFPWKVEVQVVWSVYGQECPSTWSS
ncbi:uncharacterized protein LOC124847066 [Vigna umbellata]|uniref:uncharacterized protein LOC124847066 n=1 Tax=Vigna umbellata TaxID=87088 RepID=UPI001F5F4C60|nr:uncharacterized protein LOC124847066 [Vigna umbellata]